MLGVGDVSGREYRLSTCAARRGPTDVRCGRSYKLMGSPTKNWSKLLTRQSTAVGTLCDAGSEPMLAVFRRSGLPMQLRHDGSLHVTLALQPDS